MVVVPSMNTAMAAGHGDTAELKLSAVISQEYQLYVTS